MIYIVLDIYVATYTESKIDVSGDSEARQAAVNTIIVCLTSILLCIGPCLVLTFISKWRQEQLRQKIIEEERECDKGPPQIKLYNNNSKLNLFSGQRTSADSQAILLSLKNFKRSTSSSSGSIFSLNGEFCFKQEKIGRLF